jgi:hypothetical protein
MKRKYTRLDPNQVSRIVFDEDLEANRVTIIGTEMSIAVSAEDGDSVQTVPMALRMDLQASEELDCLWAQKAVLEAPGAVRIEISIDGQTWHELPEKAPNEPFEVMAAKIRPLSPCTMILKG